MKLKNVSGAEHIKIKKLFKESFPLMERTPFNMMIRRVKKGKADFFSIYESGSWAGFAYVIPYEDMACIFYLAVDPLMRGRGCGTAAIEKLKEMYSGKRLFLSYEEVDEKAGNYEQRKKR